ncbi:hypothetical protein Rsub_13391 [Raphidocelis subcapitata]|uniref:Uncharacterized protein n=1 Tax=Raphidocelis subcapitata TaxID=307507 RepID=A0A2V0PLF6_9CHLO|nr:hypothetical protein Rsub_13391 [Raphidocelis subcapitata]|eukprot:GBG00639.1 hypothetical protein Rsub_13391 [Raphidocelis subcapitata]
MSGMQFTAPQPLRQMAAGGARSAAVRGHHTPLPAGPRRRCRLISACASSNGDAGSASSSDGGGGAATGTLAASARRRAVLLLLPAAAAARALAPAASSAAALDAAEVESAAYEAYASKDFARALQLLDSIAADEPRFLEMRAQVLVDAKSFEKAISDYSDALRLAEDADAPLTTRARLLAGRALALEGLARWREALGDYDSALRLAAAGGESPDPYVINSRGNCYNSLKEWEAARFDYLAAANIFQQSRGFRGPHGGTTARLDGAIFAASNAALMLAEMGDYDSAEGEMRRIARRAPGSADMRVALAALLWRRGQEAAAEEQWQFACDNITVGCRKYQDRDWLSRIRRWPPSMCAALSDFLALQRGAGAGAA